MGHKKYNLCSKCDFRHAAPTGKACTAGAGIQDVKKDKNDDKSVSSGQGPNLEGLDARDAARRHQKVVSVVERVEKIEQDLWTMDEKLDLIIASMKKPNLPKSDGEEIVEEWTKDISEAWDEVKSRGRARNKPTKPSRKPRSSLELQQGGETKYFERKRFAPKDHNSKGLQKLCMFVLKPSRK